MHRRIRRHPRCSLSRNTVLAELKVKVVVGFFGGLAVAHLDGNADESHADHDAPEHECSPADLANISVAASHNDLKLIDVATSIHAHTSDEGVGAENARSNDYHLIEQSYVDDACDECSTSNSQLLGRRSADGASHEHVVQEEANEGTDASTHHEIADLRPLASAKA